VLARGSAPAALVDPRARGEGGERWLAVHGGTYLALAAVTGTELPGFVGTLDDGPERVAALPARLRDPLADPERLELLQGLRIADLERVSYRVQDRLQAENRALWQRVEQSLLEKIGTDAQRGFVPLLEYRDPAITALGHSSDLRGAGDSAGALAHALAVRRDLEGAPNAPTGSLSAWFNARVALAAGAAHTDLGDGEGAERELRDALTRLLALENELVQRASELEAGRIGVLQLAAIDPFQRRRLAADLARTRDLRSQVLVSLAVNANVRLRDFDAAKSWFDQAFELRQDEFMRVLRACYAARAGRVEEARFALAGVTPAPELEYNIVCTLALLGDADRALVHLERALEQLPSRGARARQAEWARDDPDLAELAQDPRFVALLASFADRD
jgi:tetratricopeptide (TPR) repeat protein